MGKSAIVIGAGIVGLAVARALALKGFSVKVFERNEKAIGASIRNFGMIWPIGQPSGKLYERAIRSRDIWKEVSSGIGSWYDAAGSLHLAYSQEEWSVLEEVFNVYSGERQWKLLNPSQIPDHSKAAIAKGTFGALFSAEEIIVDPRQAIGILPKYLQEKFNVQFHWNNSVANIESNSITTSNGDSYQADIIFHCSGSEFESLFPEEFKKQPVTKCKLQMMRIAPQPGGWRIGPALCGGLSLIHYKSFNAATSLAGLRKVYEEEMAEYLKWGIHVMVSQNELGELIIGDSHEYGNTPEPFDKQFINQMIIDYLKRFVNFKDWSITASWNGIYTKVTDGGSEIFLNPLPSVYILNGLGGAGMTLSFGLAEDAINGL